MPSSATVGTARTRPGPLLTLLTAALLAQLALAQYEQAPFTDHAEAIGAAHGLELLDIRLAALATSDDPGDFAEELEAALGKDLPRFRGSLAAQDAALAAELEEALEELVALTEGNADAGVQEAVSEARALVERARALVVPADLRESTAFSAAVMTLILLANEGVAERYEEAVEGELDAYPAGWAGLQRIEAMWGQLEPQATETQRFEVTDMLAELGGLYPSPEPPGPEVLTDAEAAENPSQRIAGFLEELADASLFPDRDLGQMIGLTRTLVESGCEALADDQDALGEQRLAVAGFYYAQYLAGTIGLLAPDANDTLRPLWEGYAEEAEEGEEGEAVEETGEEAGDDLECDELLEGLEQAGATFGA